MKGFMASSTKSSVTNPIKISDCPFRLFRLMFAVVLFLVALFCRSNQYSLTPCESEAIERWKSGNRTTGIQSGLIFESIKNGWWQLANELIKYGQVEGLDISSDVRNGVAAIYREVSELVKLIDIQQPEQLQTLSPAFQWAESEDQIFLQIKLAYRWSSPGALAVENQNVTLLRDRVFFSGIGTHSNISKLYKLDIQLYGNIIPESSDHNWGAVGKMLMTLKKEKSGKWKRLLHDRAGKISNAHIWLEMKEKIELEEARLASEAANKTEASNSTTAPSPLTKSKNEL